MYMRSFEGVCMPYEEIGRYYQKKMLVIRERRFVGADLGLVSDVLVAFLYFDICHYQRGKYQIMEKPLKHQRGLRLTWVQTVCRAGDKNSTRHYE